MIDIISMLGYSKNSPFKGNPYLDIHTPDGLIDMSNTDMDLIGIDNKGNKKKMKAGRKNPYKFEGDVVREIPYMQTAGKVPDPKLLNYLQGLKEPQKFLNGEEISKLISKSNSVTQLPTKDIQQQQYNLKYKAAEEARQREIEYQKEQKRKRIEEGKAAERTREDATIPFTFPDGSTKLWKDMTWRERQYVSGKNLGSTLRNDNWTDIINPLAWIGDMGEGLATAPYNAQKTNSILPYITGIGAPLAAGALGSIGAKNTTQFINNTINPIPFGTKQDFSNIIQTIKNNRSKGVSLSKAEEELLNTTRLVGTISKSGDVDNSLVLLESLKNKANNLDDVHFEKLTGFKKSEIDNKIQKLQESASKKQEIVEDGYQSGSYQPDYSNLPYSSGSIDLTRMRERSRQITEHLQGIRESRQINNDIIMRFDGPIKRKSILSKIRDRIDKSEKPANMPSVESLIPSISKNPNNNPAKEILQAYNKVKQADKGKSFIPAHSLSSDSYNRLSLPLIEKGLKDDIISLNYHGLEQLNALGFPTKAGIKPELIAKEINSKISNINKLTGKKYPFAKVENNQIFYPQFTVTRKQLGGLQFLEPNDKKLPKGLGPVFANSSELAASIGGENGEPAYLIPTMKYGRPLNNPYQEFMNSGDHLGGPFKTWQEADEWEKNVRHPYVERGESIPTPIRRWSLEKGGNPYQQGGITSDQILNFLFEGDDQEEQRIQQEEQTRLLQEREGKLAEKEKSYEEKLVDIARQERMLRDEADYNEAMAIAYNMFGDEERFGNTKPGAGAPSNLRTTPFGESAGKGVNPNVLRTEKDIFSEFKGITNLGIWGDKSHQQRVSDHNTGDAQDFGIGNNVETGNKIAQKLMAEAKQRNVKYIIFNGKIWNPSISNEWRPYRGKNPHSTHVHVSYNR